MNMKSGYIDGMLDNKGFASAYGMYLEPKQNNNYCVKIANKFYFVILISCF